MSINAVLTLNLKNIVCNRVIEKYLFIAIQSTVQLPTLSVCTVVDGAVRFAGLDLAITEDTARMKVQPHFTRAFNFVFSVGQ
jgi:hypothetical protein